MISAATSAQPPTTLLSPEARLAFAPAATYPVLLAQRGARLWQRVGMFLLVVAVAIPIAAVQRVTIGLVAATAIAWSFIVGIQLAVGSIVILSAPSRRIGLSRALDLWFAGHFPYSLWLLAVAVLMSNLQGSLELIIVLAIVPSLWTAAIVSAFCRIVLGCSPRGARWRAAIHLLAVWAIGLEYVALSVGGWFQITGAATRFFE